MSETKDYIELLFSARTMVDSMWVLFATICVGIFAGLVALQRRLTIPEIIAGSLLYALSSYLTYSTAAKYSEDQYVLRHELMIKIQDLGMTDSKFKNSLLYNHYINIKNSYEENGYIKPVHRWKTYWSWIYILMIGLFYMVLASYAMYESSIGIGPPIAERPSHTTTHTDP